MSFLPKILSGLWRRRSAVLTGVVLFLAIAGTIAYLAPRDRSLVVSTVTRGANLAFAGTVLNIWALHGASICVKKPSLDFGASQIDGALCDARAFDQVDFADATLHWPDGSAGRISRQGKAAAIQVTVLEPAGSQPTIDGLALPEGSIVFLNQDVFNKGGVLTFSGDLSIGDLPAPGATGILLSGSYEIREPMPLQTRAQALVEGSFLEGDAVRFRTTGQAPPRTFGFVSFPDESSAGFHLTAYTSPEDAYLEISRLGAEPIAIAPSWIDRALHDVYIAAAAAILGFLGTIAGAAAGFNVFGERRNRQ